MPAAAPNEQSRRQFLASAGAGAVATVGVAAGAGMASPAFLHTSDKSGLGPIVLGEGDHQYECVHDWGELPRSIRYGNTHGVCEDNAGNIYIKHTVHATSDSDDAIVVFDADGRFVRSWGAEFKGGAHGLHLQQEADGEYLYLCDPNRHLIVKTTLDGEDVFRLGVPEASGLYNNEGEYRPTNIAVAPDGDFFVGDGYGKSWIHQYNAAGEYIRSFGGPGNQRGQVSCPHGLMVDTRHDEPELIVADRSNRRIHRFDLQGRVLGVVTDELRSPCHFHTHGNDLLIPDLEARVTLFDKDNTLITHLGDGESYSLRTQPRDKFVPGRFIAPHGAIFDHTGNIFVVEWVEVGRVTKLRRL